jgi:hypothetical protein
VNLILNLRASRVVLSSTELVSQSVLWLRLSQKNLKSQVHINLHAGQNSLHMPRKQMKAGHLQWWLTFETGKSHLLPPSDLVQCPATSGEQSNDQPRERKKIIPLTTWRFLWLDTACPFSNMQMTKLSL